MGAWGYGPFDNDAAGDLAVVWERYVSRGRVLDPEAWSSEGIFDFFCLYLRGAFSRAHWVREGEAPLEVIALGALYLKHALPIPDGLRRRLVEAAAFELRRERLRDWASPRRRERALVEFLASIGEERPPRSASANPVRDEVRFWKEFARQYPRWIRVVKERRGGDEEANRIWPHWFFDGVGAAIGRGARVDDPRLFNQVFQQRMMATAFAFGCWLDLPDEEILSLVDAAKRTRGEVTAIHYLSTEPPE